MSSIRRKTTVSVPLLGTSSAGRNPLPRHCLFQAVAHGRAKRGLPLGYLLSILVLLLTGCQPENGRPTQLTRNLEPTEFFQDGRSERPAVPGAVARDTWKPTSRSTPAAEPARTASRSARPRPP